MFIARGKEDALVTKNLVPGSEVYGEKRISVEVCITGFFKNRKINDFFFFGICYWYAIV